MNSRSSDTIGDYADELQSILSLSEESPSLEDELYDSEPYRRVRESSSDQDPGRPGTGGRGVSIPVQPQQSGPAQARSPSRRTPPPIPPKPAGLGRTAAIIVSPQTGPFTHFSLSPEVVIVGDDGSMQFLSMKDDLILSFDQRVLYLIDSKLTHVYIGDSELGWMVFCSGHSFSPVVLFKLTIRLVMYYLDIYFRHLCQQPALRDRIQLVTPKEVCQIASTSEGSIYFVLPNNL